MLKLYTFNISHFSEKARWTPDARLRRHVVVRRSILGKRILCHRFSGGRVGGVRRMYKTSDVEGVAKAKQRVVMTFDELDAVLAKQPYLGGDTPNRSDITLAALLAPVCRVPEHRMKWPAMPPELADLEASLSGRPTWNHVLQMYRDYRKPNHSQPARA